MENKFWLLIKKCHGEMSIGTLEAIFNKDLVTIFPRNPNLIAPTSMAIAGYPDHRLIYGATTKNQVY